MAQENHWIQKYREVPKNAHLYKMDYTYVDVYKSYKEKYGAKVGLADYKKLCYLFNKKISHKIITESFEFKLPYRLGSLRIKATKRKLAIKDGKIDVRAMGINWGETRKMWREIYPDLTIDEIYKIKGKKVIVYTNEHSNGYVMKWFWDRRLSNTKNQSAYVFKAVRGWKIEEGLYNGNRGLSRWINSDDRTNEYYE